MDTRQKIDEEKLQNILNPKKTNQSFKITIRFQKHLSKNFEEALSLARNNKDFMEEGSGEFQRYYVSFTPENVEEMHRLFELVREQESTKMYLNNKLVPYIQDLWLFLMWFYRIK